MNDQKERLELTKDLAALLNLRVAFETGTYLAKTTLFLGDEFERVFTVEANWWIWQTARANLRNRANVVACCGDSARWLDHWGQDPDISGEPGFFYLDAHWYGRLPLIDELHAIFRHWHEPVIMIDDFQVPGDSGYGWDDYGQKVGRLSLDYLREHRLPECDVFFPATPSRLSSGYRRGYGILVRSASQAAALKTVPGLRYAGKLAATGTDALHAVAT